MKLFPLVLAAAFLCACATLTQGKYSYIAIGPQNLEVRVSDPATMPVYTSRSDIGRPWASLGLMRLNGLPNDRELIGAEILRLKTEAAKKGADAAIINQYFEENSPSAYPISLAVYLVKYLDDLSEADQKKIEAFAQQAAIENAH